MHVQNTIPPGDSMLCYIAGIPPLDCHRICKGIRSKHIYMEGTAMTDMIPHWRRSCSRHRHPMETTRRLMAPPIARGAHSSQAIKRPRGNRANSQSPGPSDRPRREGIFHISTGTGSQICASAKKTGCYIQPSLHSGCGLLQRCKAPTAMACTKAARSL